MTQLAVAEPIFTRLITSKDGRDGIGRDAWPIKGIQGVRIFSGQSGLDPGLHHFEELLIPLVGSRSNNNVLKQQDHHEQLLP